MWNPEKFDVTLLVWPLLCRMGTVPELVNDDASRHCITVLLKLGLYFADIVADLGSFLFKDGKRLAQTVNKTFRMLDICFAKSPMRIGFSLVKRGNDEN